MSKLIDHTGEVINNRLILKIAGRRLVKGRTGAIFYECQCKCGRISTATIANLKLSYGCRTCRSALKTHGKSKTLEYQLLLNAKDRSRLEAIPLNIEMSDIIIPSHCPFLGIPLFPGTRQNHQNSPSLDRIMPELGYIKGNIRVISHRANTIKQNATLSEMQLLVKNWESLCELSSQQI